MEGTGKQWKKAKNLKLPKSTNENATTVIYYSNFVDYTELAALLLAHLERIFTQSPMMALNYASAETLDPKEFGEELASLISENDVHDLMATEMGPGIILGMYLAKKEFEDAEEAEDYI